jgi:hypothetical protein
VIDYIERRFGQAPGSGVDPKVISNNGLIAK